jgi:DNA-binding XRE family transcriptional regulator
VKKRNWAKEFADFRKKNKLSQAQLASVLGVCEKTIWNIEHGKEPIISNKLAFNALVKKYKENRTWPQPQA